MRGFDKVAEGMHPRIDQPLANGPVHTAPEEDALVASICRHAPFLFQVSGAAYNDEAFLANAIGRYEKFVALCSTKEQVALAPPVDIDLMWHTHMLRGAYYELESAAMRGGASSGGPLGCEGVTATRDAAWLRTLDARLAARRTRRASRLPSGAECRGEAAAVVEWWREGAGWRAGLSTV